MRQGYVDAFGEECGQTIYNGTQVIAAAITIKAGINKTKCIQLSNESTVKLPTNQWHRRTINGEVFRYAGCDW